MEAAKIIGLSPSTLRAWRGRGTGPRWFRAGRLCRYRRDWIDEWIDANACGRHTEARTETGLRDSEALRAERKFRGS